MVPLLLSSMNSDWILVSKLYSSLLKDNKTKTKKQQIRSENWNSEQRLLVFVLQFWCCWFAGKQFFPVFYLKIHWKMHQFFIFWILEYVFWRDGVCGVHRTWRAFAIKKSFFFFLKNTLNTQIQQKNASKMVNFHQILNFKKITEVL